MNIPLRPFLFWILLLSFFAGMPSLASAFSVEDVRFGVHPDKVRMVMELSGTAEFKAFAAADPSRIIVDLPQFVWNVKKISKPPQSFVQDVRQGVYQPGISRMVVDVGRPAVLKTAFIIPAAGGSKDRLVIDFEYVSLAAFESRKNLVLGNLHSSGEVPPPSTAAKAVTPVPSQTPSQKTVQNISTPKPPYQDTAEAPKTPTPRSSGEKPLIIIDAGHGGQDPGALGKHGTHEKTVVLATAKELKKKLEATGRYKVHLTRDSDIFIKLSQRVAIAREKKGDLFISLHADSIGKSDVRGASIYTLSDKASDAQTAKLAEKENKADLIAGVDLSHEDKEVANILIDLAMRDTMNQSKFFANTIVDTLKGHGIKMLPNPHRYAGFAVLKAPDIPSVLIEIGFMSNERDASMLNTHEFRGKVADSLVEGINRYFEKIKH